MKRACVSVVAGLASATAVLGTTPVLSATAAVGRISIASKSRT